jgi:hypothetical protein
MPFLIATNVLNSLVNEQTGQNRIALQITDLFPHKTQSSAVYTPNFQGPQYLYAHGRTVSTLPTTAVNVGGDTETDAIQSGLALYLLATIETAGGGALKAAEANAIADDILDRVASAQSLTASDINTAIDDTSAGATIDGGDSFATVLEIIQIASGYKVFTLPANTVIELANGTFADAVLTVAVPLGFASPADLDKLITTFSDSFYLSARRGQLKKAQTAKDEKGNPTPFVVIYDDNGNLIQ